MKNLPMSLRSDAMERRYQRDKKLGLTQPLSEVPSVWEGRFWRKVMNKYYGDIAYKKNRSFMLLPKRKVSNWWKLYPWEAVELLVIVYKLDKERGELALNLSGSRSIPDHFHLHVREQYLDRRSMRR